MKPETPNQSLDKVFTLSESTNAIKSLKNKKAVGYDSICNELLKLSTDKIHIIFKFMNPCLKLSLIPPAWCLSLTNPIHKQGPKPKPENYRGISIMNALLKGLSIMLNCRLNDFCENNNVINSGQLGFRKNNRTIDQVTTLKNIINKYVYDNKKKLYTCFVDFKKAFDSIWHEGLFYKLSKNKINGNFLDLIKHIYKHTRCAVKVDNKLTNLFEYNNGIR